MTLSPEDSYDRVVMLSLCGSSCTFCKCWIFPPRVLQHASPKQNHMKPAAEICCPAVINIHVYMNHIGREQQSRVSVGSVLPELRGRGTETEQRTTDSNFRRDSVCAGWNKTPLGEGEGRYTHSPSSTPRWSEGLEEEKKKKKEKKKKE